MRNGEEGMYEMITKGINQLEAKGKNCKFSEFECMGFTKLRKTNRLKYTLTGGTSSLSLLLFVELSHKFDHRGLARIAPML